jgi:hypothetical protein
MVRNIQRNNLEKHLFFPYLLGIKPSLLVYYKENTKYRTKNIIIVKKSHNLQHDKVSHLLELNKLNGIKDTQVIRKKG